MADIDGNRYFVAPDLPIERVVQNLQTRVEWQNQFNRDSGVVRRAWKAYRQYYGLTRDGQFNSSEVGSSGEQGEYARLKVNRFRQLITNMLVRVVGAPPAVTPVASNSDYQSVIQTKDAQALADHYARKKRIPSLQIQQAEDALIFGHAWIGFDWNTFGGPEIGIDTDVDPEGIPTTAGELVVREYCGLDIIFDSSRRDSHHDWLIARDWVNKFDLAVQWGKQQDSDGKARDISDQIASLQPPRDHFDFRSSLFGAASAEGRVPYDKSDLIPVYRFVHKKTPVMPDGAEIRFLTGGIWLVNYGALAYRELPFERLVAADLRGTPWGYSPAWDLLALQDALDTYNSIRLTNYKTFGVGCIAMPDGYETSIYDIANGLAVIPFNQSMGKPEALNLAASPEGMDAAEQELIRAMEAIGGANGVLSGSDPTKLSGSAMALLDSKTNEFHGGFTNNFKDATEGIYTKMLHVLQDNLSVPEDVAINGVVGGTTKPIDGSSVRGIDRFTVETSNPLSKTQSGRLAMAQDLLAQKLIDADEYIEIIKTGERDPLLESKFKQIELIKAENEAILRGQVPMVSEFDAHMEHIKEHATTIASPQIRADPQQVVLSALMQHQQRHVQVLMGMAGPMPIPLPIHSIIMQAIGQPVIPPPMPPGPPAGAPPPPGPGPHGPPPPGHGPPPPHSQAPANVAGAPPAHPEPNQPRMPINPATGQRAPG